MTDMPSHIAVPTGLDGAAGYAVITLGQLGQTAISVPPNTSMAAVDMMVASAYKTHTPTEHQRIAANHASLFGWDSKGADPMLWKRAEVRQREKSR